MRNTPSAADASSKFWIAWAARDVFLIAAAGAFFVGGSSWRSGTEGPFSPTAKASGGVSQIERAAALERTEAQADADRALQARIEDSIARDASLSLEDQDIQVVVRNGIVTLAGVIHSHDEKSAISFKAAQIAGASNIRNQLTVRSHQP